MNRLMKMTVCVAVMMIAATWRVQATDLSLGDPANVKAPPSGSIGFSQRGPTLDVLPGFVTPPPGYGNVAFYWWLGDPLTKERIQWQIDQLAGKGVMGLQINYAHDDKGGRLWGWTYPSDPPLLSEEWWELVNWFMKAAQKKDMAISLSDYTLGPSQGWMFDRMVEKYPEMLGKKLKMNKDGSIVVETVPGSLNPMHPESGKRYAHAFFGQFEDRNPGQGGKGLNFFFSDELRFAIDGVLWSDDFAEQFKKRKGYDIMPERAALFQDIGPRTPKIRLDYNDVMVALSEEGFFKPVFDWHQQRGMIFGCDHGGRGRDVVEFGDYFRTQRWNQGPGADQPHLGKVFVKAKVAASIAHMYERPRVWLEGFYGSGWGTSTAGLADATFANFAMGFDLLTLHGLYYTTRGGWWEWAPPCNHFHMPYWQHMGHFMDCAQRLSYLMSQGHHQCDVAIIYPVEPTAAGFGRDSSQVAFTTGETLYKSGIDLDYMDFQSLLRAQIKDKALHVSGEAYRVLVLPSMQAVRFEMLKKAVEFHNAGGLVILQGDEPIASDRIGRDDPELAALVKQLTVRAASADDVRRIIDERIPRDYSGTGYFQHRRIGPRDIYFVYDMPKDAEVTFRATGKVELWNPWTGNTSPLPIVSATATHTTLKLPLDKKEPQVIVFSPGEPVTTPPAAPVAPTVVNVDGDWDFEVHPVLDNRFGDYHWPATPTLIGPEARQFDYATSEAGPWQRTTATFGPMFHKLGPLPDDFDEKLLNPADLDPVKPITFNGQTYRWTPVDFSWRWGIENDPGRQGYHGLKGIVHDETIGLGKLIPNQGSHIKSTYEREPGGSRYYLFSTVLADRNQPATLRTGGTKLSAIWLDGTKVDPSAPVNLRKGGSKVLARYDTIGRTFIVFDTSPTPPAAPPKPPLSPVNGQPMFQERPLASTWWNNPTIAPFDAFASDASPVGWYRFMSPPGLRAMTIPARGKVQAFLGGKPMTTTDGRRFVAAEPAVKPTEVKLRIEHQRGFYAGAAFTDYIQLDTGPGSITLGDWSEIDGLRCYSGGAWYRKNITLPAAKQVTLDLGNVVSSAQVIVNGQQAGVRVAPPWTIDITKFVKPGENRIEVLVLSTAANHYVTIPTQYRGPITAGLLGPVKFLMN